MKRNIVVGFVVLSLWIGLSSWGYQGHQMISEGITNSFNSEMDIFNNWVDLIVKHSTDADSRKSSDKTEGIKHYIDVDNYAEFLDSGFISQNIDTVIARYGYDFVKSQGILPWATIRAYDSLVHHFQSKNYDKALLLAADLSHYVADGHMPLHLTRNYDGDDTGNKGIHSQYESKMISRFSDEIVFEGEVATRVDNISDFIFNYLYVSYEYKDSILIADDYARSINSNTTSTAYYNALWLKTASLTQFLFNSASSDYTKLLYSAWIEAGSPDFMDRTSSMILKHVKNEMLTSVYADYTDSMICIDFNLLHDDEVSLAIFSIDGKLIQNKNIGAFSSGHHIVKLDGSLMASGVYVMKVSSSNLTETKRFFVEF